MAPNGASEADVNTLQEFLGVSRVQATILLEKFVSVEQALNQYFEDPVRAVQPQLPQNQWEPADNIPYADDTIPSAAMSRPPSRIDYRVADTSQSKLPLAGEMTSAEAEEMQDPDLQRAIAMSKQDLSDQETGTIGSGQQFGPANRPYYDTNQWAMTTVASSREVVDHPPASKRQRLSGQPAFLRGSPETGYLAPLLNIYSSIPLTREAFILPSMRVLSYGYDPQWWSGTSDENTKSISIETSDRGSQDRHNFLAELQCLMAFLEGTNRAYGSVDALADLRAMKTYNSDTQLSRLLEKWVAAATIEVPEDPLTQVFTSTAIKAPDGEGYPPMQKDLVCLEPIVHRVEGQTLVNMLDSTIWDDNSGQINDIWIQQCAEVFTMRLYDPSNENKGLGLEIPAIWYPDRYMFEYREVTRQWRREMLNIRQEISQCILAQRRCELAQGPSKRVIRIRDVLEAASQLADPDPNQVNATEGLSEDLSNGTTSSNTSSELCEIQSQLRAILQRIDEKVKLLESRKMELYDQIKTIAYQMTEPTSDSTLSPSHKYFLQGVSTKPNITYVRRRKQEVQNLIDTDIDNNVSDFEWWRIVWGKDGRSLPPSAQRPVAQSSAGVVNLDDLMSNESINNEEAYDVHLIEEAEVIEAAKTESNTLVLVYASEHAMNMIPTSLNGALKKFVEQDNRAFVDELRREQTGDHSLAGETGDIMTQEDILMDEKSVTPNTLSELPSITRTSPPLDIDALPSPKRAKGDEAYHVYREVDSSEDEPPPYEEAIPKPQMQERKMNKIGMLADQMLEKYGGDSNEKSDTGPVHIEHAKDLLR